MSFVYAILQFEVTFVHRSLYLFFALLFAGEKKNTEKSNSKHLEKQTSSLLLPSRFDYFGTFALYSIWLFRVPNKSILTSHAFRSSGGKKCINPQHSFSWRLDLTTHGGTGAHLHFLPTDASVATLLLRLCSSAFSLDFDKLWTPEFKAKVPFTFHCGVRQVWRISNALGALIAPDRPNLDATAHSLTLAW